MRKRRRVFVGVAVLATCAAAAWWIWRDPEPDPLYCVLALGPEGQTRVLVAWRGDAADMHPGGVARGRGERLASAPEDPPGAAGGPKRLRRFDARLTDADGAAYDVHFESATDDPGADRRFWVWAVGGRVRHTTADDVALSPDPAAAPVVRFGGPLVVMPAARAPVRLAQGGGPTDLRVWVASLRPGPDRTPETLMDSATAPAGAHPVVRIDFPAASGGPPLRGTYVLDRRC